VTAWRLCQRPDALALPALPALPTQRAASQVRCCRVSSDGVRACVLCMTHHTMLTQRIQNVPTRSCRLRATNVALHVLPSKVRRLWLCGLLAQLDSSYTDVLLASARFAASRGSQVNVGSFGRSTRRHHVLTGARQGELECVQCVCVCRSVGAVEQCRHVAFVVVVPSQLFSIFSTATARPSTMSTSAITTSTIVTTNTTTKLTLTTELPPIRTQLAWRRLQLVLRPCRALCHSHRNGTSGRRHRFERK
jgi:hypothetical protein